MTGIFLLLLSCLALPAPQRELRLLKAWMAQSTKPHASIAIRGAFGVPPGPYLHDRLLAKDGGKWWIVNGWGYRVSATDEYLLMTMEGTSWW